MVIDPNFGAFQPFLRDLQNRDSEASRIRDAKAKEEKSELKHLRAENAALKKQLAEVNKSDMTLREVEGESCLKPRTA